MSPLRLSIDDDIANDKNTLLINRSDVHNSTLNEYITILNGEKESIKGDYLVHPKDDPSPKFRYGFNNHPRTVNNDNYQHDYGLRFDINGKKS